LGFFENKTPPTSAGPGDSTRPWKGVYFEAIPENCQKIREVLETRLFQKTNKTKQNQQTNQPTKHMTQKGPQKLVGVKNRIILKLEKKTSGFQVNL